LARRAADRYEDRFVAGSLGPTNVTLSLSPRVDDPSYREVTFDQLRDGYAEAVRALKEGGVDILLIETVFDTLNGKAAIAAVKEVAPEIPLFVSVTIVDRSGRNLSGQTVEAFWTSVEHAQPCAAGGNCSLRPDSCVGGVGGLTNVTGSQRCRRLSESGDYTGAVQVALDQVRGGANLLDVNMDADLLDSESAMVRFLNLIATEPEIARIPVMVDSSRPTVLEAGLKCLQGKGVANSISLKGGEESFLEQATLVRKYGAAAVVMAFDEVGQADTFERKVEICSRASDLLTQKGGLEPEDIIFDPNILPIATGIEEHAAYAKNFIDATREIKKRFP